MQLSRRLQPLLIIARLSVIPSCSNDRLAIVIRDENDSIRIGQIYVTLETFPRQIALLRCYDKMQKTIPRNRKSDARSRTMEESAG